MEVYKLAHSGQDLDDAIAGRFTTEVLNVTENGPYTPGEGVDGFSQVNVNVQPPLEELIVSENGEYLPSDGIYGFSKVKANIKLSYKRTAWYRPPDWPDITKLPLDETVNNDFYFTAVSDDVNYKSSIGIGCLDYLTVERGHVENNNFVVDETYPRATKIVVDILPENGKIQVFRYRCSATIHTLDRTGQIVEVYGRSSNKQNIINFASCQVYTQKGTCGFGFANAIGSNAFRYINLVDCEPDNASLYNAFGLPSLQYCRFPVMSGIGAGWQFGMIHNGAVNLREVDMAGWNTSAATTMANLFSNCISLRRIDFTGCDFSAVTNTGGAFNNCGSLEEIVTNGAKMPAVSFSLSGSTLLSVDSLVGVIAALPVLADGTSATLTLGATNTAKLTADQLAVATEKGWTVA